MRSTLYLKFIIVYIIFGFLSVFTVAILTPNLAEAPLIGNIATNLYRQATQMASDYLPGYFSEQISLSDVRMQLSGMEAQLNAAVWFVDRDGSLIASAQSESFPSAPAAIEAFNPAETGGSQYLVGDYHEYFEEDVITVISPVVDGYSPKGYLLVHKDMSDLDMILNTLKMSVFVTLIVIYALSFVILLAFHSCTAL